MPSNSTNIGNYLFIRILFLTEIKDMFGIRVVQICNVSFYKKVEAICAAIVV